MVIMNPLIDAIDFDERPFIAIWKSLRPVTWHACTAVHQVRRRREKQPGD
jgi:hypothetical protein